MGMVEECDCELGHCSLFLPRFAVGCPPPVVYLGYALDDSLLCDSYSLCPMLEDVGHVLDDLLVWDSNLCPILEDVF